MRTPQNVVLASAKAGIEVRSANLNVVTFMQYNSLKVLFSTDRAQVILCDIASCHRKNPVISHEKSFVDLLLQEF